MECLKDFKEGPLSSYRKRASFDWKKLKVFFETEEVIRYKQSLVDILKSDPIFDPHSDHTSLAEMRRATMARTRAIYAHREFHVENFLAHFPSIAGFFEVMFTWDTSVAVIAVVRMSLFSNVLKTLGTAQLHHHLAEASDNNEIIGCFAMTEIGHGSNTRMIQTRAIYDPATRTFVLRTPNFEATKCWSGMLGQNATHAIVYAQLHMPDGGCHGIHQFLVQIRDMHTHQTLPGIIVADMGAKAGLNGVDNGTLRFNDHRIPKSALLNRHNDITEEGQYIAKTTDRKKRFGSSLHAISISRTHLAAICNQYLTNALTCAIRFGAVRKQFGPENATTPDQEYPLLEYQMHQYRLMPYLATAVVMRVFGYFLVVEIMTIIVDGYMGTPKEDAEARGVEMHAISSASKPYAGWIARDGIQEAREACGGFGYLQAARIADLRNDNDANMTYEGENHVIMQQTSNWLIKFWPRILHGEPLSSPYQSIDFLTNARQLLSEQCMFQTVGDLIQIENVLHIFQWLVSYLLKISHERYHSHLSAGQTPLDARNNNQVFYAKELSLAYIQHFILLRFTQNISNAPDEKISNVLKRVGALFGLHHLDKHVGHLYRGGYFVGDKHSRLLQDAILLLGENVKNEAVALIDALAPDDFLLNSVLGYSDGEVYQHLEKSFLTGDGNLTRVPWWQELVPKKSKL